MFLVFQRGYSGVLRLGPQWAGSISAEDHLDFRLLHGAAGDHDDLLAATRPKKFRGDSRVGDRRREGDSWNMPADGKFHSMQQGLQLGAAFAADEGMKLVDHDVLKTTQESADLRSLIDEERFERFWSDQDQAVRVLEEGRAVFAHDIAVPPVDRYAGDCP